MTEESPREEESTSSAASGSGASVMSGPIAAPVIVGEMPLDAGTATTDDAPAESWFTLLGTTAVRNVGAATLTPYLPRPGMATGAAVIVAPGGGFLVEAMENEAWPQAQWLADRGIAAFVLKYRLQPTPMDDAFRAAVRARFAKAVAAPGAVRKLATPDAAIADGRAALALIRHRAGEWGIDPARVGWLGVSAGAMIGLDLAAGDDPARPDFVGAIYPAMDAVTVPADAPPLFVAMAADDQLYGRQGYGLAQSWHAAGRPVELHVYERGGHGFGMGAPGTTTTGTMDAFAAWMACGGWNDVR